MNLVVLVEEPGGRSVTSLILRTPAGTLITCTSLPSAFPEEGIQTAISQSDGLPGIFLVIR